MNIAIIGSGLQCNRRASALAQFQDDSLTLIAGVNAESGNRASKKFACEWVAHPDEVFDRDDIDAVIITTPPSSHFHYAQKAIQGGKHVLIEKPLTRLMSESHLLLALSQSNKVVVRCGFNHRFHPAIFELKKAIDAGQIGTPIFGRAVYGIIGRTGYENEWRADPAQAAGGHFIEQGSHLIDLFRWTMGEVSGIYCATSKNIFPKQELDDGGMAILRFSSNATASMHTTLGQWHNRFTFEIFGDEGFLTVGGLGGSYGTETLSRGTRAETGPFLSEVKEFRGEDKSWEIEWNEFRKAIKGEKSLLGTTLDGVKTMEIAAAGYASSEDRTEHQVVKL